MAAASLLTQRELGRPLTMLLRCVVISFRSRISAPVMIINNDLYI